AVPPPPSAGVSYTTLFRSRRGQGPDPGRNAGQGQGRPGYALGPDPAGAREGREDEERHRRSAGDGRDRSAEESVQGGQGGGRGIQVLERGGGCARRWGARGEGRLGWRR